MKTFPLRALLWLLILAGAAFGLRAPFLQRTQWNLDEGATFTMAQQVREGAVLYRDAADNRAPLVPYLKALVFSIWGDWNAHAVHVILALALGLVAFLLWDLCRRLGEHTTGVAAAIVFTVLALLLPGGDDALAAHTEWFVVIFSTLGFWLFARVYQTGGFGSGCLIGVAFAASTLCKQPGLLDYAVTTVLILLLWRSHASDRRQLVKLWLGSVAGLAVVAALTIAYFSKHDALADFVYYAWTYNTRLYVPAVPAWERIAGMKLGFDLAVAHAPALGLLAASGLLLILRDVSDAAANRTRNVPVLAWLIAGWSASGVISTALSGRAFGHYAIQLIPGLSLAAGWIVSRCVAFFRQPASAIWMRASVVIAFAAAGAWTGFDFIRNWKSINPQDNAPEGRLFSLVQTHSAPTERIFVWGYYPNVYLMAHRLPSTRFIYTNYVTGLIPWTNLDPLTDTAYAVVPHAWDRLMEDLSRQPPALIVDSGSIRGYLKYPINDQSRLWTVLRQNYAQVSVNDPDSRGTRLYRKLSPGEAPLSSTVRVDPGVTISGFTSFRAHERWQVRVTAPAGAHQVELYAGGERIAGVAYPVDRVVDVLFFADPAAHPEKPWRAVVTTSAGQSRSADYDFANYVKTAENIPLSGPRLHLGGAESPPRAIDSPHGLIDHSAPKTWRVFAPVTLVYDCPAELERVSFVHQLVEPAQMLSDGYDVVVDWTEGNGKPIRLLEQRLHPRTEGKDQLPQPVRLELPKAHGAGQLSVQFLNGEQNNADADRIDVSDLQSTDTGPPLRVGSAEVFPILAESSGGEAMAARASGEWSANTPARVEWLRPRDLSVLSFDYGIDEGAYTAKEGHSDGVEFSVTLVDLSGKVHPLFSQLLTPYNRPEHRGRQTAEVVLPPGVEGHLVLRAGPGPQNDITWDWAWIGPFRPKTASESVKPAPGNR